MYCAIIHTTSKPFCVSSFNKDHFLVMKSSLFICFILPCAILAISPVRLPDFVDDVARNKGKDLFDRGHNPSHLTLYPDVLKIKTIIVVNKKDNRGYSV